MNRSIPLAGGFGLFLVCSCSDDAITSAGDGDEAGALDMGAPDLGQPDVGAVDGLPAGSYHLIADWISLTDESAAFDTAFVANFEFLEDRIVVLHRNCADADFSETTYLFEATEPGEFSLSPESGEPLTFLGGAPLDDLTLAVSGPCELELTLTNGPVVASSRLEPGKVCILDWCDDLEPGSDRVRVEYCVGEPQLQCDE